MNKYSIKAFCHSEFADFSSTLKRTSWDATNDEYLCNDVLTLPVYDFDQYVKNRFDNDKLPASPDAIYIGNKKLYFIEFKNQHPADIDTAQVKRKFVKGTEILREILSKFVPKDVEFVFCIVHKNRALSNAHVIGNYISGRSKDYGLKEKNVELNNFYNDIITQPLDFYVENFPELACN